MKTDYVYIHDGPTADAPVLAALSGSFSVVQLGTGYSSGQQYMYMRFKSDALSNYKGFSATYSTQIAGKCTETNEMQYSCSSLSPKVETPRVSAFLDQS